VSVASIIAEKRACVAAAVVSDTQFCKCHDATTFSAVADRGNVISTAAAAAIAEWCICVAVASTASQFRHVGTTSTAVARGVVISTAATAAA
jgi:hypothetical protein